MMNTIKSNTLPRDEWNFIVSRSPSPSIKHSKKKVENVKEFTATFSFKDSLTDFLQKWPKKVLIFNR